MKEVSRQAKHARKVRENGGAVVHSILPAPYGDMWREVVTDCGSARSALMALLKAYNGK
jgi:predicted enzyme related to lactoylglutathione lyase